MQRLWEQVSEESKCLEGNHPVIHQHVVFTVSPLKGLWLLHWSLIKFLDFKESKDSQRTNESKGTLPLWKASRILNSFYSDYMEKRSQDSKRSTSIGMRVPCWVTDCLQDEKQQQQFCTAALTRLWDKQALLSTHTSGLFLPCSWSALFPLVWGRFESFCVGGIFVFLVTLLGLLNKRTGTAWDCSLEIDVPCSWLCAKLQSIWQPGQALPMALVPNEWHWHPFLMKSLLLELFRQLLRQPFLRFRTSVTNPSEHRAYLQE